MSKTTTSPCVNAGTALTLNPPLNQTIPHIVKINARFAEHGTFLWNLQEVWEDQTSGRYEKEAECHQNSGYVDDEKKKSKK